MDWTNETVLEFITLIAHKPELWNPNDKRYKSRNLVSKAWTEVKESLSIQSTVEELKRKKNSLFTQYRDVLRKIKTSIRNDEEVYRPSWFAFDSMNSFLGDLSRYRVHTEATEDNYEDIDDVLYQDHEEVFLLEEQHLSESPRNSDEEFQSPSRKRQRVLDDTKHQNNKSYSKESSVQIEHECDLYGKLLAEKLKKMNEDDRLKLMNEIDNLVFKRVMEARKRIGSP